MAFVYIPRTYLSVALRTDAPPRKAFGPENCIGSDVMIFPKFNCNSTSCTPAASIQKARSTGPRERYAALSPANLKQTSTHLLQKIKQTTYLRPNLCRENHWQKTLTGFGNQLFKRIPYEEWGLKSIPPLSARRASEDIEGEEETEVIYPLSIIKPGRVFDVLQKIATERQALHRKWMWGSIISMPVTLPFALIPM